MNVNELASRQKDLSRAIYVSMVTGGVADSTSIKNSIREMRAVLDQIELIYGQYSMQSDLKSLAQREQC